MSQPKGPMGSSAVAQPVPLFGSSWVALFHFLRSYLSQQKSGYAGDRSDTRH